jgi:hypothetical protein
MAKELSLDTLSEMTLSEFLGAFKNKTPWKKANFVLLLKDFQLKDKKMTVALPFRKAKDAKDAFRRVKKEKLNPNPKSAYASFELAKDENNKPIAKIKMIEGGLAPEKVEKKANLLFRKLKLSLNFITGEEQESNQESAESEERQESPSSGTSDSSSNNLRESIQQVQQDLQYFKNNIVPKYTENRLEEADLLWMEEYYRTIEDFMTLYNQSDAQVQSRLSETHAKIKTIQEKVQQLIERARERLQSSDDRRSPEELEQQRQRLEEIRSRIEEIRQQLAA